LPLSNDFESVQRLFLGAALIPNVWNRGTHTMGWKLQGIQPVPVHGTNLEYSMLIPKRARSSVPANSEAWRNKEKKANG